MELTPEQIEEKMKDLYASGWGANWKKHYDEATFKRHPMYKEEVERAEKLRHTPGAAHSHDPAYDDPHKNK